MPPDENWAPISMEGFFVLPVYHMTCKISSFLNITLNFVLYYTNTYTLHLNTTYQSDTMNESMFSFDLIENFNTFQAFNFFCHFEI